MVTLENAVVARFSYKEKKFELLVDPEKALELRSGKKIPLDDLLATNEVFKDAKKGDRVSEKELKEAFGTDDLQTVVEDIVKKGVIQLTTDQRRRLLRIRRSR